MPSRSLPLVLIVDDDDATREAFSLILGLEGFRVQTAIDGLDALQRLRSGERPRLVVLDLMMPRLDGCGLLQRLAEDDEMTSVAVVICTASPRACRAPFAIQPAGLLEKPVEPAQLVGLVRRALQSSMISHQ